MKTKAPPNRRSFASTWDEIRYLYDKLIYWFYDQGNARKALLFADRMKRSLAKVSSEEKESIFGEECRSLINEVKGNLSKAIEHREKEIQLIRRLHQIARNTPHQDRVFQAYDYSDLSDRLDLLATLYYDDGELEKAIEILQQSKELCKKHRMEFDGEDLLKECLAEQQRQKNSDSSALRRGGQGA